MTISPGIELPLSDKIFNPAGLTYRYCADNTPVLQANLVFEYLISKLSGPLELQRFGRLTHFFFKLCNVVLKLLLRHLNRFLALVRLLRRLCRLDDLTDGFLYAFRSYAVFIVITLYLSNTLGFSDIEASIISGLFSGGLYLLPMFTGAFADKIGYRKSLLVAGWTFGVMKSL